MNSGKTVFAQLMKFLPTYEFRQCVRRYQGTYKVQTFSCLDQFLCMAFAQLTYRESLRDIEVCLRARQEKLYHMGIRSKISRSTLANANENRDWRIYADFAQVLIQMARPLYANDDFGVELEQTVYALDSTTIDLVPFSISLGQISQTQRSCETAHPAGFAGQHSHRGHHYPRENPRCQYPRPTEDRSRGHLYHGSRISRFCSTLHDPSVLAFFVTRAKSNFDFQRLYSQPVDKSTGVQCDQIITLRGFYAKTDYPEKLRRVRYYDPQNNKRFSVLNQQLYSCQPLRLQNSIVVAGRSSCFSNGSSSILESKRFMERPRML